MGKKFAFLKVIFWFNPLLYLYKQSISLNHEYLADEAVISRGTPVRDYQKLLLQTIQGRTLHGLESTFNFSLTKRRLQIMTKSKSNLQFVVKFIVLFPLFAGLSLILGCESISTEHSDEAQISSVIEVEITDSDVLIVDDEVMTLDEFGRHLSERTQKPERVDFKADGNASFGFITDVQKVLREQEVLRINYSVKTSSEDESLDEVTNRFLKAAEAYMKINPGEVTREELQHEYDIVSKFFEAIQNVNNAGLEAPPPPPMVPSPEQRLNSGNDE